MKKSAIMLFTIFLVFVLCSRDSNNTPEQTTKQTTQITTGMKKEDINTTLKATEQPTRSIIIKIGGKIFSAQLYNNETAQAFANMLPLSLDMNDLHGNEKYYNLKDSLPTDSSNVGKINNGDLMLYGSACLVLFYESFSTQYSYTKIGYIENPSGLADAVGSGDITISFEK